MIALRTVLLALTLVTTVTIVVALPVEDNGIGMSTGLAEGFREAKTLDAIGKLQHPLTRLRRWSLWPFSKDEDEEEETTTTTTTTTTMATTVRSSPVMLPSTASSSEEIRKRKTQNCIDRLTELRSTTTPATETSVEEEDESSGGFWSSINPISAIKRNYRRLKESSIGQRIRNSSIGRAFRRGRNATKRVIISVGRKVREGYRKIKRKLTGEKKYRYFVDKVKEGVESGNPETIAMLNKLGINVTYDETGAAFTSVADNSETYNEVLENEGLMFCDFGHFETNVNDTSAELPLETELPDTNLEGTLDSNEEEDSFVSGEEYFVDGDKNDKPTTLPSTPTMEVPTTTQYIQQSTTQETVGYIKTTSIDSISEYSTSTPSSEFLTSSTSYPESMISSTHRGDETLASITAKTSTSMFDLITTTQETNTFESSEGTADITTPSELSSSTNAVTESITGINCTTLASGATRAESATDIEITADSTTMPTPRITYSKICNSWPTSAEFTTSSFTTTPEYNTIPEHTTLEQTAPSSEPTITTETVSSTQQPIATTTEPSITSPELTTTELPTTTGKQITITPETIIPKLNTPSPEVSTTEMNSSTTTLRVELSTITTEPTTTTKEPTTTIPEPSTTTTTPESTTTITTKPTINTTTEPTTTTTTPEPTTTTTTTPQPTTTTPEPTTTTTTTPKPTTTTTEPTTTTKPTTTTTIEPITTEDTSGSGDFPSPFGYSGGDPSITDDGFPDVFNSNSVRDRLRDIYERGDFSHDDLRNAFDFNPNDYHYYYDYDINS